MTNFLNDVLDIVVRLVPIAGIIIAWLGLSTWRRQIKGTDKYRVASDLLLEVYKVREGISIVRSPLVRFRPTENDSASREMNEYYGYVETMERRWKEVSEPVAQMSLLSLKAEAHISKDIKKAVDELLKLVRELHVTLEQYIEVSRPDSGFSLTEDFDNEGRAVLWAKPTGDNFKKRVLSSVSKIEVLTSKHI